MGYRSRVRLRHKMVDLNTTAHGPDFITITFILSFYCIFGVLHECVNNVLATGRDGCTLTSVVPEYTLLCCGHFCSPPKRTLYNQGCAPGPKVEQPLGHTFSLQTHR